MRLTQLAAVATALLLDAVAVVAQTTPNTLSGRLFDRNTGEPIHAAVVELITTKRRVLTDSLGRFSFPNISAPNVAISVSALGYLGTITSVNTGSSVRITLAPEPVPLPAIVALAQAREAHVRGATLKIFGRADLVEAGDIPVAQFVNWKAHLFTRPCQTLAYFNDFVVIGDNITNMRPELPSEWLAEECITGPMGGFGPVIVLIDDEPQRYSSESWAHQTWDLARVEVLYQYTSATTYPFNRPFAVIRMYTPTYLARTAARGSRICDRITGSDTTAIRRLEDLCIGYKPGNRLR